MGLSEREQQLLDELERGLMDSDKGIASKAARISSSVAAGASSASEISFRFASSSISQPFP
jgi:hypothetical protein